MIVANNPWEDDQGQRKDKTMKITTIILISVSLFAGFLVEEASCIDVRLWLLKGDKSCTDFYPGDEISGGFHAENNDGSGYFDIYVGFTLLDGSRIYWDEDGFTQEESPRWAEQYFSYWSYLWSDGTFRFEIPEDIEIGEYAYFVEFRYAGESESAGSRSLSFQVHPALQA